MDRANPAKFGATAKPSCCALARCFTTFVCSEVISKQVEAQTGRSRLLNACFRILAASVIATALSACALKERSASHNTDLASMEVGLPSLTSLPQSGPHKAEITQLFSLPSGGAGGAGRAISVGLDGKVLIWTLPEGKPYKLLELAAEEATFAFHEPRSLLARAHRTEVSLYSLNSLAQIASLSSLKTKVNALRFSPDGRDLLLAGADGRIYQWHFSDLLFPESRPQGSPSKLLETYIGPASAISSIVFHPRGRVFFSGDWLGSLNAWLTYRSDQFGGEYDEDLLKGGTFATNATRTSAKREDREAVDFLEISPDGEFIYDALQSGALEVWLVRGMRRTAQTQAHSGPLYDLKVSPDGKRLATLARDSKVKLWDLVLESSAPGLPLNASLKLFREIEVPGGRALAFIDNSRLLLGVQSGSLLEIKVNP